MSPTANEPRTLQLHLVHPYNIQIRRNTQVRSYLERGYRIVQLQRLTDREVLVTLSAEAEAGDG